MITSVANRGWQGDVAATDHGGAGLPLPSIVRPAKIATIEVRDTERLGVLAAPDRALVALYLLDRFGALFEQARQT